MKYNTIALLLASAPFVIAGDVLVIPPPTLSFVADLSPNLSLTETAVDGSWLRFEYRNAFGGDDQLAPGGQFDQTNLVLKGEYAVLPTLALTTELTYQLLGDPIDQFLDDGLAGSMFGAKWNAYTDGNYTGTVYANFISNSDSSSGYYSQRSNALEFGITQTYTLPSQALTFVFDVNVTNGDFEVFGEDEDITEAEVNFAAYKVLSKKWSAGLEVGYYDMDLGDQGNTTALIRTNLMANYAATENLDLTIGFNFNDGTTEGYTGTVKRQMILGATYSF